MSKEITNSKDIIDSRDIIARIGELEENLKDCYEQYKEKFEDDYEEYKNDFDEEGKSPLPIVEWLDVNQLVIMDFEDWLNSEEAYDEADKDEIDEYKALLSLQEEASGSPGWKYGEGLIRDSYFTEYTEELLKDIGYIPNDFPYWIKVDWEATAENVKQDYFGVDFDGVEYWIRS